MEALESGSKRFEDLEFRQLERESSLEEEKETVSRQLLQEKADYHRSVAKRKVSLHAHREQNILEKHFQADAVDLILTAFPCYRYAITAVMSTRVT